MLDSEREPLLNTVITIDSNNNLESNSLENDNHSINTIVIHSDNSDSVSNLSNDSGNKCRICLQNIENEIQYCNCLDTLSHIHEDCLFSWLNNSDKSTTRNEEFDNHDEEYLDLYKKIKNKEYHLLDNHYFYCEICHYRYNIFYKNSKNKPYLILIDISLILSLLILIIYSIIWFKNNLLNEINISLVINLIFLIIILGTTFSYSIYIKFCDYKLVIYPHHNKLL
jgi:E3 ubiquitin-protein ligase DOA10